MLGFTCSSRTDTTRCANGSERSTSGIDAIPARVAGAGVLGFTMTSPPSPDASVTKSRLAPCSRPTEAEGMTTGMSSSGWTTSPPDASASAWKYMS